MKRIAVIFGGQSTEHDVSIVTAIRSIIKPLELSKKYVVEPIYISKTGAWFWDKKLKNIDFFRSGEVDDFIHKASKVHLLLDDGLTLVKSSQFAGRKSYKKVDVVFPAMHGTHGEDGDLMGILEMAGVAYVGCNVSASVIAMDKVLSKQIAMANNIPISKFVHFTKQEYSKNLNNIQKNINSSLKYPLFVKPAHLGSSIGISRIEKQSELLNAIEVALHYDNKALVEEAVPNLIEVTLPIIGNNEPVPALLERPLVSATDFFDFETKYMQGGKKDGQKIASKQSAQGYSELPAKLAKPLYDKAQQLGLKVYQSLGCSGIARVDMLIDSRLNKVYFNEVNPLPGGLYSHNWNKAGISNVDLVNKLVEYAEEAWRQKNSLTTSFNTSYLKQF